jgi:CRISPR/Cas system CMR-associated protein Cmr5 small subunit
MKTLAQIRAANALHSSKVPGMGRGQKGGDAISGFPMLIKTDGLLAAIAFSLEVNKEGKPKQEGAHHIVTAIAKHLSTEGIEVCDARTARDLVDELSGDDASKLRRATAEALAYLAYLKRFVA